MDILEARMRENAAIDDSVAAAASVLHSVARAQAAAANTERHDLGDGEVTPPRVNRGRHEAVQASPVSPRVKALAAASAARRSSKVGVTSKVIEAPAEVPVVSLHEEDDESFSITNKVGACRSGSRLSSGTTGIPRLKSQRMPAASAGRPSAGEARQADMPLAADDPNPDLPVDSQLSLLRSQLRLARKQQHDTNAELSATRAELTEAEKRLALGAEEKTRLLRAVSAAEAGLTKAKRAASTAEAREMETRNQLANMQKEVSNTARAAKSAETSTSSFEVRLNRALEDVDRLKAELASSRAAATETERTHKESTASMQSQIKKLEKQRADLVIAFKKQMRLIDILKRQRIHMEAARLLAFTEDEFSKLMDSAPP